VARDRRAVTARVERVDPAPAKLEGGDGLALIAYPSEPLYDGARGEPLVAAGSAGYDDAVGVGLLAEINTETARSSASARATS